MTTPAIRPLPYRLRPTARHERQANFARVAGPSLLVFGVMFAFFLAGR